jgi:hypothetical protein
MAGERGQATIEWTALVLLVALALGALVAFGSHVDGRSYGGFLARKILCAVRGGCQGGRDQLELAYGGRDAALVRRYAPNIVYEPGEKEIPIDYRRCRSTGCGDAPTDRSLDVSQTSAGLAATVFTHVVHAGTSTYIQYWFYYPDSDTYVTGTHLGWKVLNVANLILGTHRSLGRYPGFHRDDWEGYEVVVGNRRTLVRATTHGHYQWCKQAQCRNEWGYPTGWTRVSRGSHAGHIPLRTKLKGVWRGPDVHFVLNLPRLVGRYDVNGPAYPGVDFQERTTVSADLNLVPLERIDTSAAPKFDGIDPPWEKDAYTEPWLDES